MTKRFIQTVAAMSAAAVAFTAVPATAQINAGRKGGIEKARAAKTAELPRCTKALGTMGISDPETRWWEGLGLGSPEALLRVYACLLYTSPSPRD